MVICVNKPSSILSLISLQMTKDDSLLTPETELETKIIKDPEFQAWLSWWVPRAGHPEGEVYYHVLEVLQNVDKYHVCDKREKLRLIAMIHDTFKYKVDETKDRSWENHHGMYARRFAEKYIDDPEILDIIELHDEAFNAWQKGNRDGKWDKAEARATKLVERLWDKLPLYIDFYRCDNETGDKI